MAIDRQAVLASVETLQKNGLLSPAEAQRIRAEAGAPKLAGSFPRAAPASTLKPEVLAKIKAAGKTEAQVWAEIHEQLAKLQGAVAALGKMGPAGAAQLRKLGAPAGATASGVVATIQDILNKSGTGTSPMDQTVAAVPKVPTAPSLATQLRADHSFVQGVTIHTSAMALAQNLGRASNAMEAELRAIIAREMKRGSEFETALVTAQEEIRRRVAAGLM